MKSKPVVKKTKYVCSVCGCEVQGDAVTVADCEEHPLAMIVEAETK